MIPSELLGSNARYLDALADTTPPGLLGTPFGVVSDALRVVAASVWDVDPTVYRAGIAWAWYLGARPSALAVDGFRALLCAALVSECAPLVRESQTVAELLALLTLWMDYRPVFADMEALFSTYGVHVDVRAISDPEGQALLPVDDTRLAFYIFVLSMDWSRPMLLGEIAETARRASPLGARPFVLYLVEGLASVPVAIAPTDGFLWVDVWESAVPVAPPGPTLPTVTKLNTLYNTAGSVSTGGVQTLRTTNSAGGPTLDYDNALTYAVWYYRPSGSAVYGDLSKVAIVSNNGYVAITATESVQAYYIGVYTCNSLSAIIIMVYNSSNEAYNAFKFTTNGTDYYYVLDGTQTDWTDDLSGIGYRLDMQFYFYFKMSNYSPLDETFDYMSNYNYWTLRVRDQTDAEFLSALGLRVTVSYSDGPFGFLKYDTSVYSYELKEILRPDGSSAEFNLSDFYLTPSSNNLAAELWCNSSYSTPVRSCLISIKPIS